MDAATIALICGLVTLAIERIASWSLRIKKSKCSSCMEIDMEEDPQSEDKK